MRRREQVIGIFAILQAKNPVAIFGPAASDFIRLTRKKRGKMHVLCAGTFHLIVNDLLDLAPNAKPQRQPREDSGSLATDIPGAHEESVRRHFRVGRVLAQGTHEQLRKSGHHVCQPTAWG